MKKTLLFLTFLPAFAFGQIQYNKINLEVDFATPSKEFTSYWNSTGFTPGDLLLRKDMQQTLDYLSSVPNHGVKYLRPHWMLNLIGSKNIDTKKPEYNFKKFDAAFDEMISRGFKPIFEIMGFPNLEWEVKGNEYDKDAQQQKNEVKQWVPDFEQKDDYKKWYAFVKVVVKHLEDRYGKEELKTWYFECTNEPDLQHFWGQSLPALLNYWDASSEAIKAVDPEYSFGGPGTAKGVSEHFKAILAHCDNGENAITRKKGAALDFISVHRKAKTYRMIDVENECVNYIRENHPKFGNIPFWNDEADPLAGWQQPFWWRADSWYSCFVVHSIDVHNRLSIDSAGVNFSLLSNDNGFMGNWYHRTHLARIFDSTKINNFWLFKQPDLTAMTLLALSTGERYNVKGYLTTREHSVIIPTKNQYGDIVILAVNKPEFGPLREQGKPQQVIKPEQRHDYLSSGTIVDLALKNIRENKTNVTHIRLDNMHGNAFTEWVTLEMPYEITSEEYKMIASNQEPVIVKADQIDRISNLELVMPPASIYMIILSGEKQKPDAPKIISIKDYNGLNNEKTKFIRWEQVAGQISTYNVYASYDGKDFVKINPQPLFDCGFLDVLNKNVKNVEYKIEAVSLDGKASGI